MKRQSNSKEERQLRKVLAHLGYTETQINILVKIAGRPRTALEINKLTQVPRSHIHSFLKQLCEANSRIVEATDTRPKRYYLRAKALEAAVIAKTNEAKSELVELEELDVKTLLESMRALEKKVQTVSVMPRHISGTKAFHDAAASILEQSKDVLIGTNWPFPWLKEYQIDNSPPKDTENYWAAHSRFLEKTKEKPDQFHIAYIVNVEVFIRLLNKKSSSRIQESLEAIFRCVELIKEGYSLDFIPRPSEAREKKPTLSTFLTGRDTGLFVLSIAHNQDVVLEGLYLEHPGLAQAYGTFIDMHRSRSRKYAERPEDRLMNMLETILTRVDLPKITRKAYEQRLARMRAS